MTDPFFEVLQRLTAENDKPDDRKYDKMLDRIAEADMETETLEKWLSKMYRCRQNRLGRIFFMKLAGLSAADIAGVLNVSVEYVYNAERRICLCYRYLRQNLAHQRFCRARAKRIKDFYEQSQPAVDE